MVLVRRIIEGEEIVEAYIDFFFYGILAPALVSRTLPEEIVNKLAISARRRDRAPRRGATDKSGAV